MGSWHVHRSVLAPACLACRPWCWVWLLCHCASNSHSSLTGWNKVRMHRSGNDFSYITDIPKGKHCYRFFVNDQWQCASDQPPVRNEEDGELYVGARRAAGVPRPLLVAITSAFAPVNHFSHPALRYIWWLRYNLVDLTTFQSLEDEYMKTVNKEHEEEQYTAVIPNFEDDFLYRCVSDIHQCVCHACCRRLLL